MKLATYNIWNEDNGVGIRFEQLIQEITLADADIIALQEVDTKVYYDMKKRLGLYPYSEFRHYSGETEGLAIFSKYFLEDCMFLHEDEKYGNSYGLSVHFQAVNSKYSLTNVHLPWDSINAKEEQIIAIDNFIHGQIDSADYFILLGDFNCDTSSSVHRFLVGDQTLYGNDAKPYWLEVSSTFASLHGTKALPTMDFINNPRWKGQTTIYTPKNFDRIYILDNWNYFSFENVQLFGTEVSPVTGLCASDHYGVAADVKFVI